MWKIYNEDKTNLLTNTFVSKFGVPEPVFNEFSFLWPDNCRSGFRPIRARDTLRELKNLDIDSGTGPDNIATYVLKRCKYVLVAPLTKLIRLIFKQERWPESWIIHWIMPLHKRKSIYNPMNYRGIHLTSQISKLSERVLRGLFLPSLERFAFGPNQFAYRSGRGARDAIAFYVLSWIETFNHHQKMGLYASDVSGAFDKVSSLLLITKLKSFGVHEKMIGIIQS